jgi:hypothetical protein
MDPDMNEATIAISALASASVSVMTACLTARLQSAADRTRWRHEVARVFTEAAALGPEQAQRLAAQFNAAWNRLARRVVRPVMNRSLRSPSGSAPCGWRMPATARSAGSSGDGGRRVLLIPERMLGPSRCCGVELVGLNAHGDAEAADRVKVALEHALALGERAVGSRAPESRAEQA